MKSKRSGAWDIGGSYIMKRNKPFTRWTIVGVVIASVLMIMGMQLAMVLLTSEIPTWTNRQLLALMMIVPVFIILWIFLTFIFTRLTRIIRQLSRQMNRVASGDFSVRLDLKQAGPLRETYRDFNKMAQELEGVSKLRDDFISEFSHEFRTPITSINGFAEMLKDETLSEEQKKLYIDIIADESNRLTNLSKNILLLTSLEKQTIVTDVQTYSLDEQLRQSVITFLPQIETKKIELEVDLVKAKLTSNQDLIKHIWTNLLNNCLKFTPENGKITVKNQVLTGKTRVVITNSGPNLSQKDQEKLFNKFYHAKDSADGLGLGLAIVKRVLDLVGGKITVNNLPKTGVEFIVELNT